MHATDASWGKEELKNWPHNRKCYTYNGQTFTTDRLAGFDLIILVLCAFVLTDLVLFTATSAHPDLRDAMALNADRPFSVATAIFAHRDFGHLAGNLAFFAFLSIFFIGVNASADLKMRRRLSRVFCLGSFLGGIAAGAVQLYVWQSSSSFEITACGASGVVYTAMGILLASALCGLPARLARLRIIDYDQFAADSSGIFYAVPFSACAAVLFTYMSLFETNSFFYVSQNTAWLCHELGFVFGLSASLLFFVLYYSKKYRGG